MRTEVVTDEEHTYINLMNIHTPFIEDLDTLSHLLDLKNVHRDHKRVEMGNDQWNLVFYFDQRTSLYSVVFLSDVEFDETDPVQTKLIGKGI